MRIPVGAAYIDSVEGFTTSTPMLIANVFPAPDAVGIPQQSGDKATPIHISIFDTSANGMPLPAGANTRVWVTSDAVRTLVLSVVGGAPVYDAAWSSSSFFSAFSSDSITWDEHRAILVRNTPFTSQDEIIVEVTASNVDGDSAAKIYAFTIEDTTAPALTGARTQGLKTVRVTFDEAMEQGTDVLGDALRVRDISGGVSIEPRDGIIPPRVIAPKEVFEATDIGQFIGIAGAYNALNNDIFTIISVIDAKTVEIDQELVVAEILPLEQLVTVSPYRVCGVTDAQRRIPFFNPVAIGAESVLGSNVPGTEIDVLFSTELSPAREYTFSIAGVLNDAIGNPFTADAVAFTTEALCTPQERIDADYNYLDMMPFENLQEDASGDLERLLRCLDEVLQLLLCDIDRFPEIIDIDMTALNNLNALLVHLGSPFSFTASLSESDKRRLAAGLVDIYKRKGVEVNIESLISFIMGIEIDLVPYSGFDSWVLGVSQLGVDTTLAAGTSFQRFSFEAVSPIVLTEAQRRQLIEIVEYMKPAHTHFIRLTEPEEESAPAVQWILGTSELGVDTVLS